jgi:hypothetical protein
MDFSRTERNLDSSENNDESTVAALSRSGCFEARSKTASRAVRGLLAVPSAMTCAINITAQKKSAHMVGTLSGPTRNSDFLFTHSSLLHRPAPDSPRQLWCRACRMCFHCPTPRSRRPREEVHCQTPTNYGNQGHQRTPTYFARAVARIAGSRDVGSRRWRSDDPRTSGGCRRELNAGPPQHIPSRMITDQIRLCRSGLCGM